MSALDFSIVAFSQVDNSWFTALAPGLGGGRIRDRGRLPGRHQCRPGRKRVYDIEQAVSPAQSMAFSRRRQSASARPGLPG
jgi:hypothetical protein